MAALAHTEAHHIQFPDQFEGKEEDQMKDPRSKAAQNDKLGKKGKGKDGEEGRVKFCKKDWQLLLEWCETDNNFDTIKGTDKTTRVGCKYPTKRQAFHDLALHINENQYKGSTLVKLNWEVARNRYQYLGLLYKKAKETINSTGWGLTEKDNAKGILNLDQKIETLCPFYDRVHSLLGSTPCTDLKSNTYASSLGGQSVEHVPWTAAPPENVVDVGDSSETSSDLPDETERIMTESQQGDIAMDASGPQLSPHTPIPAFQTPLPVPVTPTLSPAHEDSPVESPLDATQRAAPSKSKLNKTASYPNKKRHGSDKGQSLTGAFSFGMESMSVEKAKYNEMKERAYELRFQSLQADRAVRNELAQKKLALDSEVAQQKLALEYERVSIEKLKVNNEIHSARLEATMNIVNNNKERSAEELAAILAAFTAILPPLP